MSCGNCNKAFPSPSADTVLCNLCNKQFCYECSAIDRAAINSLKKFSNVCYFCNCCKAWIANKDMSALLQKIDMIADRAAEKLDIKKIVMEVAENRKLINTLINKVAGDKATVSKLTAVSEGESNTMSCTRPELNQEVVGTGTPINLIKTVSVQNKKFLYVSRIDPSVTSNHIIEFICDKLPDCTSNDIDCKLLLSKDRVIDSSLTFVSFKIGLKETHYNQLNNSEAWPTGVLIRPFTNYPRLAKNRVGVAFPPLK